MAKDIWTKFWDMHSGGGSKERYEHIYIQALEEEAKRIFYGKFGHNPERVTCTCCGEDYSISSGELSQITGYHRGCEYSGKRYVDKPGKDSTEKYQTMEEYSNRSDVLLIYDKDIKDEWRESDVPTQGYVWMD